MGIRFVFLFFFFFLFYDNNDWWSFIEIAKFNLDQKRKEFGKLNKEIAQKKKAKENADDLIAKSKEIDAEVQKLKEKESELKKMLDDKISQIGNIVHESVVVSKDEVSSILFLSFIFFFSL